MAKIIKDCWTQEKIPTERKKEFFTKLRDLCCLYSVHIGVDNFEIPKELLDKGDKDHIPTLFFEFHNGDTYYWDSQLDQDLEFGVYNTFINCQDERDIIGINGVNFQTEEND